MSSYQASQARQSLQQLWRMPALTIARFTLRSYCKSGWILGDIALVWLLYAAFFLEFGGDVSYFFATVGQGLAVVSILGTVVMVQRAFNARMYLPLARLVSRSSYVRGVILATLTLRVPLYLLMLLLGAGYHAHAPAFGVQGATWSTMLLGSIGCILNLMIVSTLTVVLSVPVATRRIQIAFLAWLVLILSSNNVPSFILAVFTLIRLPLAPLAACYNLGTTSVSWSSLLMVLLALGSIVGLTVLAAYWLNKRDLIFV